MMYLDLESVVDEVEGWQRRQVTGRFGPVVQGLPNGVAYV